MEFQDLYSWALGFTVGDASIDRRFLAIKRVDVETSRLSTLACFIVVFNKLVNTPIELKFYVRYNSFARYKVRALVRVDKDFLNKLTPKQPCQLKDMLLDDGF